LTAKDPQHFERRFKSKRGVHEVVRIGIAWVFTCLVLVVPWLKAQQDQVQKEAGQVKSNRFLSGESFEPTDLIQKYYQSLLLEKRKTKAPSVSGVEEEALLGQLRPSVALEGPIDPSKYIVGPFDGISVNLWSETPLSFNTSVTPEGTVIIPTVGEIRVAGRSLKEVKEIVQREVRKKYTTGEVSTTLILPRSFVVKVAGVVNRPGTYVVSAVDRVDKAIYLANPPLVSQAEHTNPLKIVEKEAPPSLWSTDTTPKEREPSLRNIKLYRANGDSIEVDLIRFFATGDATHNPYLQDGDMIVVPGLNLEANAISIQGAVKIPGRFEYRSGDSLSLIFKIADGPQAVADLENTEVVRFKPDGRTFERMVVDARKVLEGVTDLALQPADRVFVRSKRHLREEFNVTVAGEVRRPGTYAITRDSTKLSEVIDWAGGFTSEAAVPECKIIRPTTSDDPAAQNPDYERLTEMRLSGMDRKEREYFNYEATIKRGFVSVDFKRLFLEGDRTQDVALKGGDFIVVPARSKTVYVYGQVSNPGYLTYIPGLDFQYYIQRAGGYSEAADEGNVFLIKAGTKKWVKAGEEPVEEADAIFVSRHTEPDQERDFAYYFGLARDIISVGTTAATIYFLIHQANK
jgi:polysaccharide export outer membrane protein